MKSRIYNSGDIIFAGYTDVNDTIRSGLFLVLYDEKKDEECLCDNNIIALKITSKFQPKYTYYYELQEGDFNLRATSRVCCSKPYVLSKDKINGILSSLDTISLRNVYKLYNKFNFQLANQVLDML